jgi:hypothetical protein
MRSVGPQGRLVACHLVSGSGTPPQAMARPINEALKT